MPGEGSRWSPKLVACRKPQRAAGAVWDFRTDCHDVSVFNGDIAFGFYIRNTAGRYGRPSRSLSTVHGDDNFGWVVARVLIDQKPKIVNRPTSRRAIPVSTPGRDKVRKGATHVES
jgi:hypothetical protein